MKEQVVIIPVHNQLYYLKPCVESVYAKSPKARVIIVDDGSNDRDTYAWIVANKAIYGYATIYHDIAQGFTKSVNDGMEYALKHYDFNCLCLLNSDTEIETDDWFAKVEWYFLNGENIGVASVMSDNALAQTVKNKALYLANIDNKPAVYSYLLHGFCYFIAKEFLEKHGLMDAEMFPHYGSEDDYSLMSLKVGYKNLLVGKVFVHHANARSYTDAQRAKIILKSFPDLNKKWGKALINRCGIMSVKAGNYVNVYRKP